MKKRMAVWFVALTLLMGAILPTGAVETATASGEGWRTREEAFLVPYALEYTAAHMEEYAAFGEGVYESYVGQLGDYKTELLEDLGVNEEAFRKIVWVSSLESEEAEKIAEEGKRDWWAFIIQAYEEEFPEDIDTVGIPWALMLYGYDSVEEFAWGQWEQGEDAETARQYLAALYVQSRQAAANNHETTLKYREQYPGSYEDFDPDKGYEGDWAYMKGNTIARYGLQNEVEWKEYMYVRYMEDGYLYDQEQTAKREEYPARWPAEYAAFDERAWYDGYYHDMGAPESYMEREGLDAEGFKQTMFVEWVDRKLSFFNGYCVTVNGTPIQFRFYRDLEGEVTGPKVEKERILIPLRAAAEALGLTVEWRAETNEVVCSDGNTTVTFTLDSTQYSGGTLDVAPYAEKGITYLPLRALGETLGCGVTWYQDFATAALTTER